MWRIHTIYEAMGVEKWIWQIFSCSITIAGLWGVLQVWSTPLHGPVHKPDNNE